MKEVGGQEYFLHKLLVNIYILILDILNDEVHNMIGKGCEVLYHDLTPDLIGNPKVFVNLSFDALGYDIYLARQKGQLFESGGLMFSNAKDGLYTVQNPDGSSSYLTRSQLQDINFEPFSFKTITGLDLSNYDEQSKTVMCQMDSGLVKKKLSELSVYDPCSIGRKSNLTSSYVSLITLMVSMSSSSS